MAHDPRMDGLPLFISYPRTGSHWINCVMELYFDRPRLREARTTLFDTRRTDWMWFHDHDLDLTIRHGDVLYLFREPVSTFFSNLTYYSRLPGSASFGKSPMAADEATVVKFCEDYRGHLAKWLLSEQKARTAVRYDRFKSEQAAEFEKICRHFGRPFDPARMERCFAKATPEAMAAQTVDPAAIGEHLLTKSYGSERKQFAARWEKEITARVATPELAPWFS